MTAIEQTPDDPFVACLFDAPGIAVWRHDGEPGGARYVGDVVEGFVLPDASIVGAMNSMPEGVPFVIERS